MLRRILLSTLALSLSIDQNQASAFATSTQSAILPQRNQLLPHPPTKPSRTMSHPPRGGGLRSTASTEPAPAKRIRIVALDGIRALLCIHIVLGHFLRFANPSQFWLRFFAQINVTVGAFFAISGYVTAYTSTEVGQPAVSPKMVGVPSQKWWLTKIMSYYPMHWLVSLLFAPMFLYSDVNYSGWPTALFHGLLSTTLTQSWFPMHAEVWNAPMWFLSSMTFSTAILPFALPKIANMDKRALRRSTAWLFLIKLLPVLGYVYDSNVWTLVEGVTAPKHHPALNAFNVQRFHPVFNVAEILMGATVCRLAMLDGADKDKETPETNALSTAVPLIGLVGLLVARAANWIPACSDLLFRSVVFVPLFLKFVLGAHRNAVRKISDPVSKMLSSKPLVWLGGLSFPIYIVHGPIGQVFYKRLIANKLWGGVLKGPEYFILYLSTVLLSAVLLQNVFLRNKGVQTWSKRRVEGFAAWM